MPDEGSIQQRYKTQNEYLAERKSLEHDINKLLDERAETVKKSDNIDKVIVEQIQNKYSELVNSGRMRLSLETQIAAKAKALENLSGDTAQLVKGEIDQLKIYVRERKALEKITQLQLETLQGTLKKRQEERELDSSRLDNIVGFLGKFGEVFGIQKKYNDGLKKQGGYLAKNRVILSSILTILELSFTAFRHFDDELAKFRITMGMLRTDVFRISRDMKHVAIEMAHVGVTIEGATAATIALANEFGGTMKISKDLLETTALLKAQLGVAEETSAGFLRNISALSRSTAQAQRHMVYFADAISSAAGVPLNLVMQDVAKMSGNALALVSKMPGQIVKTAVAARQMGTTLNKMADASATILNFTESVQAEMEASVLIGEAINIQRARQLAYEGKIVESTKAIVREARRINFEKLDYFQMQAFAAASGRSAEELLKMIQAERQLNEARSNASLGLQKEVAAYDRLMAMKEADLHNEGLQRELMVRRLANQARMEVLQQHFNQMILQMGEILFPIFDKSIQFVGFMMQGIKGMMGLLSPLKAVEQTVIKISQIGKFFGATKAFTAPLGAFAAKFGTIVDKILTFGVGSAKIFGIIGKFGTIGKLILPFLKVLGPIGWIITAFQTIASLIKHIGRFMRGEESFGTALWGVVMDVVLEPFIKAWDWIKGIFVGHSPSKLALGIVQGIIAVQAKIFDALTYPWRHFLAWVADKIPGMGGLAKKLRGGLEGGLTDTGLLEKKAGTPEATPLAVTPEAAPVSTTITSVSTPEEQKRKEADSVALNSILAAINLLNANLQSGKIGVYIDGQLMSATLSRQTQFKGGYGMNTV